ncbi:hypothetical protein ACP4OV_010537 [Aristida adscensionis]
MAVFPGRRDDDDGHGKPGRRVAPRRSWSRVEGRQRAPATTTAAPDPSSVGLWLCLLRLGATEDPLSSFEYGTILALIESDAEGIGGSGFVECIREHIHSLAMSLDIKELLKTAITRANFRSDMATIRDALEVSAGMYRKTLTTFQTTFSVIYYPCQYGRSFGIFPLDNVNNCRDIRTQFTLETLTAIHPFNSRCRKNALKSLGGQWIRQLTFFADPSKTKSETKGMVIIACSHSGSPSAIFVPEVFRNVLTIFITAAFLNFLQFLFECTISECLVNISSNTRFSSHMEGLEELGMLTNDAIHSEICHGCWLVDNSSNHILQLYSKCFLKIRTLGMLRSKFAAILTREPFARFLYLFMDRKSHIVKFADIWNAFIISLREEDLLSNRERDLLVVSSSGGDTSVFQSPPFLLASKIPIALDMDPYTEVVDRIRDSIEDSIQRRSLVREFRLDELPQLSAKFDELLEN